MRKTKGHSVSKKTRILLVCLLIVALVAAGIVGYRLLNKPQDLKIIKKVGISSSDATPKTTAPSTIAAPPTKSLSDNNNVATGGGITSNNGSGANTNSSQWISSTSGNITLKQPLANSLLSSGVTVSGSAKVNQVNVRLIDNDVGVIAQGTLPVTNGTFSGTLTFHSTSNTGRLDVFSTDADGAEVNEIQMGVKL